MSLTTTIIVNLVLDTLVVLAILLVLWWGIATDRQDRARRQPLPNETPELEGCWPDSEQERVAA